MGFVPREQEKLAVIDQIPLFLNVPKNDKKFIALSSSIVEYKKGDIVYKEGTEADAFYCVVTGRLRAFISRHGSEESLEYLRRGKYFGTISILTKEPHSASVQAVNDSIILKIPKDAFEKILKRVPALAIHFTQTLSRQLKTKGLSKKIFESVIISVFGASDKIGTSNYAFNLGASLKTQTAKKVVLVKLEDEAKELSRKYVALDSPFFEDASIRESVFHYSCGIDSINVLRKPKDAPVLSSLLSYLTKDYHYVLVDLAVKMDDETTEVLKQSDIVHLLTVSDKESLLLTSSLIDTLARSVSGSGYKIRVISTEYGARPIDFIKRKELLKHEIYAALPDMSKTGYALDSTDNPVIMAYPDCEYSRMIRRISRDVGDCMVGLALGAGAAQGLAHIGILKIIEKENIPIDVVAGTSIGALIGSLWVSGKKAEDIERIILKFKSRMAVWRLIDLAMPTKGLIKGREIRRFLTSFLGDKTFHDLKMPFRIVTCDIARREEVVLQEGSLVDAIMASIAIPGMFEPVKIGSRLLMDGGIINPLPISVLTRMGISKIIAVNALPSPEDVQKFKAKDLNIFDMIVRNIQASEYLLAEAACNNADIVMHPVLSGVDWYEIYELERIIKRGEEEASGFLPNLKKLAAS